MSSTASNYNIPRLEIGISVVALAVIASMASSFTLMLEAKMTGLGALLIIILHSSMMFASSFVEEEHHFWYWASSGWLAWVFSNQ